MNAPKLDRKSLVVLLLTIIVCALIPQSVFSQTEKLGIVRYTPPKGWNKTVKENIVAFAGASATGS